MIIFSNQLWLSRITIRLVKYALSGVKEKHKERTIYSLKQVDQLYKNQMKSRINFYGAGNVENQVFD